MESYYKSLVSNIHDFKEMDLFLVITNTPNVSSFSFLFSLLNASFLFLSSGGALGIQYWNVKPKMHTYRI